MPFPPRPPFSLCFPLIHNACRTPFPQAQWITAIFLGASIIINAIGMARDTLTIPGPPPAMERKVGKVVHKQGTVKMLDPHPPVAPPPPWILRSIIGLIPDLDPTPHFHTRRAVG